MPKVILPRRTLLKGLVAGVAASIALPTLDAMLNSHGTAMADGKPIPKRFGLWFWGNGVRRAHWIEALPESDAVYVQVNQIAPDPGETMPEFGLKLRKFLADAPVRNVILDLRHNNGGNTATYTELLRTLVGHTLKEGNRLYVVIGRGVYSATSNLITDLSDSRHPSSWESRAAGPAIRMATSPSRFSRTAVFAGS